VAVSVNFTVARFAGHGDLRVGPAGSPTPLASILNFGLQTIANATPVSLGPLRGEKGFAVYAAVSGTDLIADVNGYYLPARELASGETQRGNWSVGGLSAPGAGHFVWTALTFPLELASAPAAPNANFVEFGEPSTSSCPGTNANPQAAPGQLCVYATNCSNAAIQCIGPGSAGSCGTADPYGAYLYWTTTGAGEVFCYGTWAVTAP
jgi:hypothetical protein